MRNNNAGTGRITCAVLLLALTAGLSGCGSAVEEYTVIGATNEVSQVTSEPFSSIYPTLEYAKDDEVEGTSTPYGSTSAAAEGATSAADEEPERKWRTILEDVSLFSSPDGGKVIIVVPKGSKVDVLSDKENQWYQIRYHGTTGYVKSGYFVEDWEAEKEERKKREEEEARRKAEEERKRKEEEARKKAEAEAKKKAEEEAKKKAAEEAKKKAEEEAKKKAEEEAKKKAAEEAKKKAEEEAKKKAAEEAKKKAEEEAKKKAEEEAKKKAAEEKKRKEEETKKKAAEEKKRKEQEAKKKAEEEAKRKAAEERARAMADGEVTRRLAETVNMRDPDEPDILYGIVPHGSTVTVLEDLGDGWYLVDYDGMEGMISGGYFTEDDP